MSEQAVIDRIVGWFKNNSTTPRKTKYERWREYPNEPDAAHEGHHRCITHAPNVNYCYECGHHYRPRSDDPIIGGEADV